MPKKNVDYANTIIYKICCEDSNVKDEYIGHTTNLVQRKYAHKIACNSCKNDLEIYNIIRNNGGWKNWKTIELGRYCCKDANEAKLKEVEHYTQSNQANISAKFLINYAQNCKAFSSGNSVEPNGTNSHANGTNLETNGTTQLVCLNCKKEFKTKSGLWKHKQTCKQNKIDEPKLTDKNVILKILKQNSELIKENSELRKEYTDIKKLIFQIVKNRTNNTTTNNTYTNSHNKAFNLNFFLNETCKNAMNITDFVDSIKLQLTDLINLGELGYVDGISNIIVKNLNNLDETVRPIHCTDKKRETFYVKDKGQWEKEDEDRKKIKNIIKTIEDKNIKLLSGFREKYPEYKNSSSKMSDKYDKIVVEVMSSDKNKEEKILKNISNATTINK